MNPPNDRKDFSMPVLLIASGTTGCETALLMQRLAEHHGLTRDGDGPVRIVCLDHGAPSLALGGGAGQAILPPGTLLETRVPDAWQLEELEADGRLRCLPRHWTAAEYRAAREGIGAGQKPRIGALDFATVQRPFEERVALVLRSIYEYPEQRKALARGATQKGDSLSVLICGSSAGGTASGALASCLGCIRKVANELGMPCRIEASFSLVGTLDGHNPEQARLNQNMTLKLLTQVFTGAIRLNPFHKDIANFELPLDRIFLFRNDNDSGGIRSLELVNADHALFEFIRQRTELGSRLRTEAINLETPAARDGHGVPAVACTAGISVIHADRTRLNRFAAAEVSARFLAGLAESASAKAVEQEAEHAARRLHLVETEDEADAAERVMRPEALGGQSASDRVRALFASLSGDLRPVERCRALDRRLTHVLQTEVSENLAPLMREEGGKLVQEVSRVLDEAERRVMSKATGVDEQRRFLRLLHALVEAFAGVNREKAEALGQLCRAALERVGASRQVLNEMTRLSGLMRWLRGLSAGRVARDLERDGEEALVLSVEIEARRVLAEVVYPQVLDVISSRAVRVEQAAGGIQEARAACERDCNGLARESSPLTVPVGVELVNAESLPLMTAELLKKCGGFGQMRSRMLAWFLDEFGSLAAFAARDWESLRARIVAEAEKVLAPHVSDFSVWSVFERVYNTPLMREMQILQALRESRGRLPMRRAGTAATKWIKLVGAPTPEQGEAFVDMLARLDRTAGEWTHVATPGYEDAVWIVQYATGVSLRALYREERRGGQRMSVREQAEQGPDPVTALMPGLNMTRAEAFEILLKAYATGLLTATDEGYSLHLDGDSHFLAKTPEGMSAAIRKGYWLAAHVHGHFAARLDRDPAGVLELLESLERVGDARPGSPADLFGRECMGRVLEEARELCVYLHRPAAAAAEMR